MPDDPKETVRRYVEDVQDGHQLDVIDEVVAADFVNHLSKVGATDRSTLKEGEARWLAAFPDQRWTIQLMIAEGDLVATLKTCEGTHRGDWRGHPPTGRRIVLEVLDVMRVKDGQIVEHWGTADMTSLTNQLQSDTRES